MQEVKTYLMSPPGLPDHLGTLPSKEAYCRNIKSSETMERSWTILLRSQWGSAAAASTCLNRIYVEYIDISTYCMKESRYLFSNFD